MIDRGTSTLVAYWKEGRRVQHPKQRSTCTARSKIRWARIFKFKKRSRALKIQDPRSTVLLLKRDLHVCMCQPPLYYY